MRRVCPPCAIRIPVTVWLAGTVWLCLTPGAGIARQAAAQASPGVLARGVRLSGTIVDGRTLQPVAGATVRLLDVASGRRGSMAESDEHGTYRFAPVLPGAYALSIVRIGYQRGSASLDLLVGTDPDLTIALVPEEVDLEPLVVTVDRSASRLVDFEHRRLVGNGTFVTRADIEEQRPFLVTDVFRTLAGVRVLPGRDGNTLMLRGGCRPLMYFDGVAVDPGPSLDLSLRPDDIEAIEVHSNATAPAQYARNACGVILVWTRAPVRVRGHGSWWKPLLVAGGLLGVKLLLVR